MICSEAHLREVDTMSGAQVFRLTAFPCVNHNIYGEVPYMDAASRYVLFLRQYLPGRPSELWRADLQTHRVQHIDEGLAGLAGAAVTADGSIFYYQRRQGNQALLVALDMATLDRTERPIDPLIGPQGLGSVTSDRRTYLARTAMENGDTAVVAIDVETGACRIVFSSPDISNPHIQADPGNEGAILVQINELQGTPGDSRPTHERSRCIGLGLLDLRSGSMARLRVGRPFTEVNCQGHQCFIGRTGRVLLTLSESGGSPSGEELRERRRRNMEEGNLVSIGAGDAAFRVVAKGHRFTHPNASRDGRFFVADTSERKLVVGSIETGRCRVLCDTRSSFCSAQYTHPHPYLSPDGRWAVFNSDATGIPHLHAARIPEGFLAELAGAKTDGDTGGTGKDRLTRTVDE